MKEFVISMDVTNRTWREIESEEETYDDATASVVEDDQGAVTISLDLYYSKYGEFER